MPVRHGTAVRMEFAGAVYHLISRGNDRRKTLSRSSVGDVAAAIPVEDIFSHCISCFSYWDGLDKDDDILKATVRFDQRRLVRQCLAAVILILAYFDQRKLRRGVREPGLADDRTCVSRRQRSFR